MKATDGTLNDKLKLVEQLARNVHENWTIGRLNNGWTFNSLKTMTDLLKTMYN